MEKDLEEHIEEKLDRLSVAAQPKRSLLSESFRKFSSFIAWRLGSHWSFIAACAIVLVWLATGPMFHFSDTWQLVINTGTTIVTFLMVFVIQSTQNRDARATALKLDELIRTTRARNVFADLVHASQEELDAFQKEFEALRTESENPHGRASKQHRGRA